MSLSTISQLTFDDAVVDATVNYDLTGDKEWGHGFWIEVHVDHKTVANIEISGVYRTQVKARKALKKALNNLGSVL